MNVHVILREESICASDIQTIGIQLLKPSDIYSWVVIFGHKRPKEPIFPPPEYIYNTWNKHLSEASTAYNQ